MNRPTHFEFHTANPEGAIAFYTRVFGWNFQKWEGPMDYWLITTGGGEGVGINGGMVRRMGAAPAEGQAVNAFINTIKVESVDAAGLKITANGGTIALPKMPIPGMGWLAYGKDVDGNIFGVMQDDPAAK